MQLGKPEGEVYQEAAVKQAEKYCGTPNGAESLGIKQNIPTTGVAGC